MSRILTKEEVEAIWDGLEFVGRCKDCITAILTAQRDLSDRENAEAIQQAKDERDKVATETIRVLTEGYEQKIQQTKRETAESIFKELEQLADNGDNTLEIFVTFKIWDALKARYLKDKEG